MSSKDGEMNVVIKYDEKSKEAFKAAICDKENTSIDVTTPELLKEVNKMRLAANIDRNNQWMNIAIEKR